MNFLGTLLVVYLFWAVFFPESMGRDSRRVYDKIMDGWNKKS